MRKMSLKWKVTLWYAGMLLSLVALLFVFFLSVSDRLMRTESNSILEEAVWDFIDDIELEDGGWELDDDIRFYDGGVVFSVYDKDGNLMAGSVPRNFPEHTILKAYAAQQFSGAAGTWTTYDAAVPYGDGQVFWVRGIYGPNSMSMLENQLYRILLLIGPLLVLIAVLVGYSITRRALLPVEEIRKTAEEISGGSDLSLRIHAEKATGEVRRMADTFNHMFERLEASFEKERQFTSDASHELRTPVAVILSQAEYALLPDAEQEEMKEGLEIIKEQAQSMSELLSQLLFLARADSGSAKLIRENVNLSLIAQNAMEETGARAAGRRIELQAQITPDLTVYGDRRSLERAFVNLLENAVEYGREGGWVRLTVEEKDDTVICRVEDNGIGIRAEHLDKIWNRFYRVDSVRGSEQGNSGLGLPIVKWIVEQHGGTIGAESRFGEGSCFSIEFPKTAAAASSSP